MAETNVYFPPLDASPEEKAMAIKVIDHYISPVQIVHAGVPMPKTGKIKKVVNIEE